jgi:5-methylcytosine-specific restriction endonuclease McrA
MTFIAPYARLAKANLEIGAMSKTQFTCDTCGCRILRNESKSGRHFCSTSHKAQWQRQQKEHIGYDKTWLSDQYISQRKSADQIAREIGRDPKRVWEWLRDYGIETRPRGTDYGNGFKAGEPSAFLGNKHSEETKRKISEIAKLAGRVPFDPKVGSYMKGRKGADVPSWRGGVSPERQSFYSSEEWKCSVKLVWKRDDAKCRRCGKSHNDANTRGTFAIHHIESFAVIEKRAELSNLILLCKPCHLWVHSRQNKQKEFLA